MLQSNSLIKNMEITLVCQQNKVKLILLIQWVFLVCILCSSSCNFISVKAT